jgi:hypothetical protein
VNEPAARDDANEKWVRERSRARRSARMLYVFHSVCCMVAQGFCPSRLQAVKEMVLSRSVTV